MDALFAACKRLTAAEQVLRTAQGEQAEADLLRKQASELAPVEPLRAVVACRTDYVCVPAFIWSSEAHAALQQLRSTLVEPILPQPAKRSLRHSEVLGRSVPPA